MHVYQQWVRFFLEDGWATYLLNTHLYGPSSSYMFITLLCYCNFHTKSFVVFVRGTCLALPQIRHEHVSVR